MCECRECDKDATRNLFRQQNQWKSAFTKFAHPAARPHANFGFKGALAPPHRSSTSRSLLLPAQQIITVVLAARSAGVSTESRCTGTPEITRVSHAPQIPCSQEYDRSIPASRKTSRMLFPGGITNSRPERRSSTTNPPASGGASLGVKYSTCFCSPGQFAVACSNAASIGAGPQQ